MKATSLYLGEPSDRGTAVVLLALGGPASGSGSSPSWKKNKSLKDNSALRVGSFLAQGHQILI